MQGVPVKNLQLETDHVGMLTGLLFGYIICIGIQIM